MAHAVNIIVTEVNRWDICRVEAMLYMGKNNKSRVSKCTAAMLTGFLSLEKKKLIFNINLYFQIMVECTFLDYIMGGCQLNFTVS